MGCPILPHCFLQEFQPSSLIPLLRDIAFQDFAFMVDSAPEVVTLVSDFDEDLVQVALPLRTPPHGFGPPFPDLVCEVCAEAVDSEADTFVTYINAAFVEKVFDIPE